MKHFRLSLALFLLISILFLHLGQWQLGVTAGLYRADNSALPVVLSLLLIVVLPFWGRHAVALPLVLWLGTLFLLRAPQLWPRPIDEAALQLHIAELSIVGVLVFLAHRVNVSLNEFAEAVQDLALNGNQLYRYYPDPDAASDEIRLEFTRAREGHRPLSLLLIETKPADLSVTFNRMMQEIQRAIVNRYTYLRMARVIRQQLRLSDLILHEEQHQRIILLCPEADTVQSTSLVQQINAALQEQLGLRTTWASATFPEDGFTFDGLMARAEGKLSPQAPASFNGTQPNRLQPPTDLAALKEG
jgi:hypothetical protein